MSVQTMYADRKMSAEEAIRFIMDGDTVVVPTAAAEAPTIQAAIGVHRRNYNNVAISQLLPMRKFEYFDPETVANVRTETYFASPVSRGPIHEGWADFIPNYFLEIPDLMDRKLIKSDVLVTLASPMDEHGYFSLSLATDYALAAARNARAVLLEVNPNVPYAFGENKIHISQVTAVVENDDPVIEVGMPEVTPVFEKIGAYVADMINDGDTLQIGFGGIPDAVVVQLKEKKHLGIHTEMIGDGILSLVEAGAVDCSRKNYNQGKIIASFALGSKKLYQFMNRNPMVEMQPITFTNDPYLAGQNDNLCAINGTLQVDFLGQCGSESLGQRIFSSTGGQVDFVRAANRSKGGRAIIVVPSTAKDDTISRIVPMLTQGTHVTTGKNDINYIVTEYGVAQLRGKTYKQRTQELIAIAHPNFRDELRAEAKKLKII